MGLFLVLLMDLSFIFIAISQEDGSDKHENDNVISKERSIINHCAETNELDQFGQYLLPPESLIYEAPEQAQYEIVACIKTLGAILLDVGASWCIQGFVSGHRVFLLEARDYGPILNQLFDKTRYKQDPMVSTSNIAPQTSSSFQNFQFEGYGDDESKRIQIIICRVLLPNLAS